MNKYQIHVHIATLYVLYEVCTYKFCNRTLQCLKFECYVQFWLKIAILCSINSLISSANIFFPPTKFHHSNYFVSIPASFLYSFIVSSLVLGVQNSRLFFWLTAHPLYPSRATPPLSLVTLCAYFVKVQDCQPFVCLASGAAKNQYSYNHGTCIMHQHRR